MATGAVRYKNITKEDIANPTTNRKKPVTTEAFESYPEKY